MESLNMKRQKKLKTRKCRNKLRKNSRGSSEEAGTSKHYESETRRESHSTKENGKNCVTTSRITLKGFPKAIRSSTVTRAPRERDESASLPASTATDSDNELQNNENGLDENGNTLPFGFSSWSAYNDWIIQYQNCQQLVDAISLHLRETYPELLEETYEIKPLDNTFRQKRLKAPSPPSAESGIPLAGTSPNTSNPSNSLFTEDYPCPPLQTSMPGILDTPEYNYYPHKLN